MADSHLKGKTLTEENTSRLLKHFSGEGPPVNDRWAALWDAGDFLPWDQGAPNPALVDVLSDRTDLVGSTAFVEDDNGARRRKRALVPGCGRGYDVLLLSSLGYDAYGLEVSTKAVEEANAWASQHLTDYSMRDDAVGRGTAKFIVGDFFSDNWLEQANGNGRFEFIYDYTFFCALAPRLRPSWARRCWDLLSEHPESRLVCVEFPTSKKLSKGGPPYAAPSSAYLAHLGHPGREISYDIEGEPESLEGGEFEPGNGFRRIAHWKADRSHPMGQGMDWVGVWQRSI
ncbi:S-adenosyl-L-methionine-dependent methyltransferase [Aspergillus affinis]|uniref:S-adenosyl-L-methionine-dependent methyltransferase n=1 Tax=Aspergillus affinis TaxID=1070780 RepID=UPI0022FE05FD|nr:S-adenosyl-L-methionine-dependent methyltransferase [Aspergillus affinis]KAI9040580.1 S-adenosyl-L-methionine-dependent methyltransferase [Aspergillus affinis]